MLRQLIEAGVQPLKTDFADGLRIHPRRDLRERRRLLADLAPFGKEGLVLQGDCVRRRLAECAIGAVRQQLRANAGRPFVRDAKVLQAGVQELARELIDGRPIGRPQRQRLRDALELPLWLSKHSVVVEQHMRVGGDVLKGIQVVVQPQQVGFQRAEAVAAGQGLRHRPGIADDPNETGWEMAFPKQHSAPKGPEAGGPWVLERPDRVVGGLRPQQRLRLLDQGR